MKYSIKTTARFIIAMLVLASFQTVRADILTVTNDTNVATWDAINGNAPFYTNSISGLTGQGFSQSSGSGPYLAFGETFTITNNGAGGLTGAAGQSNYMLNAISVIASGGTGPVQVHLFDVTTNISSSNGNVATTTGATYNFVANGDLLGNGGGLTFTNALAGERQLQILLDNGGNSQDQVVLGAAHTYALEFWVPKATAGIMNWYRSLTSDPGGQGLGAHDAGLANARVTLNVLGLAGGAPRVFTLALYGTPTTAALSANANTNIITPTQFSFVVDDFNANGVTSSNQPSYDFYNSATNVYSQGYITNVWWNWFGSAFAGSAWNTNQNNPVTGVPGVLECDLNWVAGSQFVLWEMGPANDEYNIPGVSSLTYTSLEMDVKWDPSSVSYKGSQTYSNYGPLRIGERPASYGQDWLAFGGGMANTNIAVGDTNWHHLIVALNPANSDQNNFQGVLIGADSGSYAGGQFVGPAKFYVSNIKFKAPIAAPPIPPPSLSIQKVTPGLRIYAGSIVNTYDRSDLVTEDANQSWIGGAGYPVTYSFSLLSYPNNNINQTMLELIPVNSLNGTGTYGNEFGDFEAGNGLWVVLTPNGGGAVTASVEWKTNFFAANPGPGTLGTTNYNPNYRPLFFTNSTAIGTWTLTFNSASTGSLTPPGGTAQNFVIADPNVSSDFANPVIAQYGLQPNSSAGEGLYETWGFIAETNILDGNEYEDFTHESSDMTLNATTGYWTTPTGFFSTANSMNQATIRMAIINPTNTDLYWVSWTTPAQSFTNLVTGTNLLLSPATHWVTPTYYSSGSDDIAPRGNPEPEGNNMVEVIPADNSATVNGLPGGPIAPNAYFILETNTPSTTP